MAGELDFASTQRVAQLLKEVDEKDEALAKARDDVALLADRCKALEAALRLLLDDVKTYPAWERPCHAVDVAETALHPKEAAR